MLCFVVRLRNHQNQLWSMWQNSNIVSGSMSSLKFKKKFKYLGWKSKHFFQNMLNVWSMHSGPENLKKYRQKNSWNQISQIFFVKLHFWQFWTLSQFKNLFLAIFEIAKKWNLVKKISWNWIIWFHEFFWPGLF